MTITEVLAGYYEPAEIGRRRPESLYGSLKMWAHLNREGIEVARCTVERLMRRNGWQGVTRVKKVRTTIQDPTAVRAPDLVDRNWRVDNPNELVVADFTHVGMAGGWHAYTAFVVDAYADTIVGWEGSETKQTVFVESALRQAASFRDRQGTPIGGAIHHSDAGSQYTSVRFGEALFLAGLTPSIGSVGDAYDNALCETIIGLYKSECIRADSPFRTGPLVTVSDLERVTAAWVHWYNNHRLMHRLGRIPQPNTRPTTMQHSVTARKRHTRNEVRTEPGTAQTKRPRLPDVRELSAPATPQPRSQMGYSTHHQDRGHKPPMIAWNHKRVHWDHETRVGELGLNYGRNRKS